MAQFLEELWTHGHPNFIQPFEVPKEDTTVVEDLECICLECEQNKETSKWFKCLLANRYMVEETEDSSNNKEHVSTITKTSQESSTMAVTMDQHNRDD